MNELTGDFFIANGTEYNRKDFSGFESLIALNPSVYEVIRLERGVPLFFEDYFDRLSSSFGQLEKKMKYSKSEILNFIRRLCELNHHTSGPVKLVFGTGDFDFSLIFLMKPHLPEPEEYRSGVKAVLMKETRENPNVKSWNPGLRERSVSYLTKENAYEAILVNEKGYITEASRSNVFFIRGDELFTTPVELILPGITRKKVLEVCSENQIKVHFVKIHKDSLGDYTSCFVTGTARKIVPVRIIDRIKFEVETPMLKRVSFLFHTYVEKYIRNHSSFS
jgi:branched-chain amino acid aminotransferase